MRRLLLVLIPLTMLPWLWQSVPVIAAQQAAKQQVAQQSSAQEKQVAPAVAAQVAAPAGQYAGEATCALCHAAVATKFASNPHSELALLHNGKGVTCESCHGPGQAHVASGGDPTKIRQLDRLSAKQLDATCLSCHASAHPNFLRSDHAKADVSCSSCHSIHGPVAAAVPAPPAEAAAPAASDAAPAVGPAPAAVVAPIAVVATKKTSVSTRFFGVLKPDASAHDPLQWNTASLDVPGANPNLLKASQPQLCYSCHVDIKPAFSQPFHHKVNEGLMKCTDCHDSHGTFRNNQLRSTADQNMICTKCHTETRGPFVFEHAAVKAEGCLSCHSPHGSQNARLLNVPNINQMCNQCHSPVASGTIHGQGAGSAEVQSCVSCHTMIHGSNINPALIR
jgi:predicted CXXCH cytochrome family protein